MKKHTIWSKEVLEDIVKNSISYSQCLDKMNLKKAGGNYKNLQKNIDKFEIDASHMKHQAWNAGNQIVPFDNLKTSKDIRKRLLKELGNTCQKCKRSEWNELPIPLELEHIDGNNKNHSRENVTLLCCNCHAQTSTWRNRKR